MIATAIMTMTIFLPLIMLPEPQAGAVWLDMQPGDTNVLGFDWYYDYNVIDRERDGVQYVPMIWCDRWPRFAYGRAAFDYFREAGEHLGHEYDGPLLFLNEPDLPGTDSDGGQCDMRPKEAAYMYGALLREFPLAELVGPNMSHADSFGGWTWLREFYWWLDFLGYRAPDAAGLHTYLGNDPKVLLDSFFSLMAEVGGPETVWITEMGNCDPAVVGRMIDTFRADSRVERYAIFTVRGWKAPDCLNAMYQWPGQRTAVGEVWYERHQQ